MKRPSLLVTSPARGLRRWGVVGTLAALAALGWPGGVALAGTAVKEATIQVSSLSASATQVSYTADFESAAALTKGTSTITLDAPAGTTLPSGVCYTVSDDATGLSGCSVPVLSGTSAVLTSPVNVASGDPVSVLVTGVGNPATTGSKTFQVSTSGDPTAVSLHYKLVAKQTVSGATLQVSSSSAGASGVTYSATFTSPDRLTTGSQATITFSGGAALPAGACAIWTDDTTGTRAGTCGGTVSGTTVTVTGMQASPLDVNTITVYGVTSPGSMGTYHLTLSTTSDPKPVTLAYSIGSKQSVSNPFLQLSSYTASAASVNWSVGFVAPDRLAGGNSGPGSTVTVKAPTGTVFPAGGCGSYVVIDAGPAGSQGPLSGCISATVTGSTVSIDMPFNTNPDNAIFVVIKGVQNPPTMSSVHVSTSADPGAVTIPLSGPTAMTDTDQLSSTSAGATGVLYAETFASTGALTNGASTVTLSSPGATFPLCSPGGQYIVIDDTTGVDSSFCPVIGSTAGPSITLADGGLTTSAGDEITVLAYGVASSATSGGGTFAVSTVPAAGGASLSINLTTPTSVSPPALSLASTSASASVVAYSATFTVANGFTVNGAGDDFSAIKLTAASGTTFPASGQATVFNDSTGTGAGSTYTGSGTTATVLPGSGGNLGAGPGDLISVIVFGGTNPSSSGPQSASLSTTSDPAAASASYMLSPQASVSKDIVQLSSRAGGAAGVTYSFTFLTANRLVSATNSSSTITVTLPAGTGMPSPGSGDVNVVDNTIGAGCGGSAAISGTTATVQVGTGACPQALGAGDVVTLVLTGVTNAPSLSGASVQVSTSSDPAVVTTAVP